MRKEMKGFTLVELIIVIAVIGVLAAILIPVFANVIDKANAKSAVSDGRNTISQYITDATDDAGMPHNIVVFVKKGSSMYIYGYNKDGDGSMMMSKEGKAYKNHSSPAQLMASYSFNDKHPGEVPDLTGATVYDEEDDGAFWLVPYDGATPTAAAAGVGVKGFHGTKESTETYRQLDLEMTETLGEDVWVFHGYMLNGTYTMDNGSGGTGESGGVKYTITFAKGNTGGNDAKVTVPDAVEIEEGETFIPGGYPDATYAHTVSDEEWYVFDGWNPASSFTVTENTTITATWVKYTATKYTLSFDTDGGTLNAAAGVTDGMQIISGTNVTDYIKNSSAEKNGYTFGGWDNGEGVVYSDAYIGSIIMNDDINLTAVWTENEYALTIDNNNGDATYKLGDYVQGTNNVTLPAAPQKDGYVFDYWKSSIVADVTEHGANGTYSMPGQDVTMTAQWKDKFTVEYYAYDGTTDAAGTIEVNADDTIDLPDTTSVIKPNTLTVDYTFTGWACSLGGTYAPGDEYTVIGDVTFTAVFADVPKFMVSFTAGELAGNPNVSGIPASIYATPTTIINPNTYGTPTFEYPGSGSDYEFDGWEPATLTMAESTVTFEAQWIETPYYTLTFDKGAGDSMNLGTLTGWSNGDALRSGTNITDLVKNSTATKANADFMGWKLGETTYNSESSTVPFTGNTTLVAQFNDHKYTVKYQAGEGTGVEYTQGAGYTMNQEITLITLASSGFTAPEGKTFSHWQSSLGEPDYNAGATYTVTNNVTFTAIWTEDVGKTVTVSFLDTWNTETLTGGIITVSSSATQVNFSDLTQDVIPDYWVQGATTTVNINTGDTATFSGDRHNTEVAGDVGTDYQVVTTITGLRKIDTAMSANYWQLNDIANSGATWKPLGWTASTHTAASADDITKFAGIYNGNGKSITGFTANYTNTSNTYIGLMAYSNGTIRNLKIACSSSVMGFQRVGSFAGQNNGTIEHCYVSSDDWSISAQNTTNTGGAAGGIAGFNTGTISDCVTEVCQVFAFNYAGGITGYNAAGATVSGCTSYSGINEAYIDSAPYADIQLFSAGGIVGNNVGAVSNCKVSTQYLPICGSKQVGGIAGVQGSSGTISNCEVLLKNGNVIHSYCDVGGAVGTNNSGSISNVHVWATTTTSEIAAAGSAAHNVGTSGSITGAYAGGIVGYTSGGSITNCGAGGASGFSIYSANTGGTGYYYWMVGGIAGATNSTPISLSWTYYVNLNRHTTSTASGTIGCLQCVGGITGYASGAITNCWAHNVSYTAYSYGAGLVGYLDGVSISGCWTMIKGHAYNQGAQCGDCVGANDSGSISSVYCFDRYNTYNSLGTNLTNPSKPSAVTSLPSGLSSSNWQVRSGGVTLELIANNYYVMDIADDIRPSGM